MWAVIQMCDDNAVTAVWGPFTDKEAAGKFSDQYNEEYDGSPWHTIVRPMTEVWKNLE
jgi:hypothetical protein